MPIKVGVIGLQGAIKEHIGIVEATLKSMDISGITIPIKKPEQIFDCDALIIPGGESTTISRLLAKSGLSSAIRKRYEKAEFPVMGTCAGMVLLAKQIIGKHSVIPLSLMDMEVKRNAFGRQRESFEADLRIKNFDKPYHAVFIRAPVATRVWGKCKVLARFNQKIVMVKQNSCPALAFHPELTNDLRIHQYFLSSIG
jgi:5'-phosphate synthase pdxT subunit